MAAVEQLITDNLNIWSSTVKAKSAAGRGTSKKNHLYGVKKLRELILELAVRGLLVPQDPSDEPASELLKKIAVEKAKLIKEGKIKKQKPLPPIEDNEKPFELPVGWEWVRLQDISKYIQRGKGPRYSDFGRVRVVSQRCIQWNGFDLEVSRYVKDESLAQYQEERFLKNNDLLWNSTGTGTAGRINLVTGIPPMSLVADSHVTVIRTLLKNGNFICSYISSGGIQSRIEPSSENSIVSGTTNQVELNTSTVVNLVLPLPPEAEQHRIVAKVDELMLLCDQLEQQQESSISAHQTLVKTLLDALTEASEREGFNQAWVRISDHFDTLFTTEWSIDQLKQTILQLAVMGKLVKQDPNDEPASELLKKIAVEKAKLIKEGKIKKQKPLPPIGEDEKPFELPMGWELARFRDIYSLEYGNNLPGQIRSETGEYAVYGSNGIVGSHNECCINAPCVVVGRKGSAGALNLCLDEGCWVTDVAYSVIPPSVLSVEFTFRQFQTLGLKVLGKGIKPGLNRNEVYLLPVALPPIKEQGRIVVKVDELMALCDNLKSRIETAQVTQLQLADALTEQALS